MAGRVAPLSVRACSVEHVFETSRLCEGGATGGVAGDAPAGGASVAAPADLARAVLVAVQGLFSGADAAFAGQWDDEDRVVVLGELDRVSELVGVFRGRVLAAHRAEGRWARDGDRSGLNY